MSEKIIHVVPYGNKELKAVESDEHEFLMSSHDVAQGYGISASTLKMHKSRHDDELIEGKHFISTVTNSDSRNLQQKRTMWTKKGIVRLGFFIKSQEAKRFRDWAEDYIVNGSTHGRSVSNAEIGALVGMFQQSMALQQQHNEMMMVSMNTMMEMMGSISTMVKNVVEVQTQTASDHLAPAQLDKIKIEVNRTAPLVAEVYGQSIDESIKMIYRELNARMGVFTYYHIHASDYEEAMGILKKIQAKQKERIEAKRIFDEKVRTGEIIIGIDPLEIY